MSELINTPSNRSGFRSHLLATASAMVLLAAAGKADFAKADDTDRPVLWIELGGQLSRLDDAQEGFGSPFKESRPSTLSPSQPFEKMPINSIDETGKLEFQPDGSDWVFSASIRYGRSSDGRLVHQQTHPKPNYLHFTEINPNNGYVFPPITQTQIPNAARFAETGTENRESHSIIDFQAGKDVGLGLFGRNGSSTINAGVRFAQFSRSSAVTLKSDPDFHRKYFYENFPSYNLNNIKRVVGSGFHSNEASFNAARSFRGIGPSLSWNASAPIMGNPKDGEASLDWGLNAAVLFGRQRAKIHYQMTGRYHPSSYLYYGGHCRGCLLPTSQPLPVNLARSHTVIVPNAGGFAGLSFHYANAKISAGYRADFFWGAMDGGIDAAKKENVGFYGPLATISVGLGG